MVMVELIGMDYLEHFKVMTGLQGQLDQMDELVQLEIEALPDQEELQGQQALQVAQALWDHKE
jgi:hypothetical protein